MPFVIHNHNHSRCWRSPSLWSTRRSAVTTLVPWTLETPSSFTSLERTLDSLWQGFIMMITMVIVFIHIWIHIISWSPPSPWQPSRPWSSPWQPSWSSLQGPGPARHCQEHSWGDNCYQWSVLHGQALYEWRWWWRRRIMTMIVSLHDDDDGYSADLHHILKRWTPG